VSRNQIIRTIQEHFPSLKRDFAVRSLGLFGSYARGDAGKRSDVDLLVEFDEVPGLFEFIELENRLSKLLGKKVDLVTKDALKPAIGKIILAEVLPI
jgi:hypothetical protein